LESLRRALVQAGELQGYNIVANFARCSDDLRYAALNFSAALSRASPEEYRGTRKALNF